MWRVRVREKWAEKGLEQEPLPVAGTVWDVTFTCRLMKDGNHLRVFPACDKGRALSLLWGCYGDVDRCINSFKVYVKS